MQRAGHTVLERSPMTNLRHYRIYIAWPLMVLMMSLSLPMGYARAALVTTEQAIERSDAAVHRAEIKSLLSRDDIKGQLAAMGVNAEEAAARIDSLSDAEVAEVASRIDDLPAGQAVGSVVLVLLLVVIIFLIWPFN